MTSAAIRHILQEGGRKDTPVARLYYMSRSGASPQVACVVGKKVHLHAVVRHRYQRLLREALRPLSRQYPAYDMVIVAQPEILHIKKLGELQKILQPYFEKLFKEN